MAKVTEKTVVEKTEKAKPVKAVQTVDKSKADKPKKPNAIKRWWAETRGELRKVTWPTRKAAVRLSIIVAIVMFGMAILLGLLDFGFSRLIALIVG